MKLHLEKATIAISYYKKNHQLEIYMQLLHFKMDYFNMKIKILKFSKSLILFLSFFLSYKDLHLFIIQKFKNEPKKIYIYITTIEFTTNFTYIYIYIFFFIFNLDHT